MTQSLSFSTAGAHAKPLSVSLFQVARLTLWSFALVSLCFFIPEMGFDSFVSSGFNSGASYVAYPMFWVVSLLPFIVVLEVWDGYRSTAVSKGRLVVLIGFTFVITGSVGGGIPAFYFAYLYPSGNVGHLPYFMLGAGVVAWLLMLGASRLLIWKKA